MQLEDIASKLGLGLTDDAACLVAKAIRDGAYQNAGNMLSSLARLVPTPGICSLPSYDWFRRR
eukprot:6859152-Pyramimonas_sp.AAC.1